MRHQKGERLDRRVGIKGGGCSIMVAYGFKVQGLINTTGLGTGRRTAADKARRIARLFSPSPEVASEDEEELLSPVDSVRALEEQVRTEQAGSGTSTIPDKDGSGRRTPSLGS